MNKLYETSWVSFRAIIKSPIFFMLFSTVLFCSCVEKKMSLNEAKQFSVSMSTNAFVPPPRNVIDVLEVLSQPGQFDKSITAKIIAKADELPPKTDDSRKLALFYFDRGIAARELGRYKQQIDDLRKALKYAKSARSFDKKKYSEILLYLGIAEAMNGNFQQSVEYLKKSIRLIPRPGSYYILAWGYFETGDFTAGEKATNKGLSIMAGNPSDQRVNTLRLITRELFKANLSYYKGLYVEAETFRRSSLNRMRQSFYKSEFPYIYLGHRNRLAKNLALQGRLFEAELEARETLKEALGHGGKNSGSTGEIIKRLGHILLLQGRTAEAEKIILAGINIQKESGLSENSVFMGNSKTLLCKVYIAMRNYSKAARLFDQIKMGMKENQYFFNKKIGRSPDAMIALIKTGRVAEAMPLISDSYTSFHKYLGKTNILTVKMLVLKGMANAAQGNVDQSLEDFQESLPVLLNEQSDSYFDYLNRQYLQIYTEAYLDLLIGIYKNGQERKYNIDVASESFRLIEKIRGSHVQKALGQSGARAAATNIELSDLLRKEQDAQRQINALQVTLTNALTASDDQHNPIAMQELKSSIQSFKKVRTTLVEEIRKGFPKYSEFTDPQPVNFVDIQKKLHAKEALITIYPVGEYTLVWAIPKTGDVAFSIASLGTEELKQTVVHLRKALDPGPQNFGNIPKYDLEKAYSLYSTFLLPVKKGWKDSEDLLVSVSGALATIPLSILPTEYIQHQQESDLLFNNYKKVPWLIRKVSITRIPSATSFVTLRSIPEGSPDRKSFAGFGDPFFNLEQMALAKKRTVSEKVVMSSRVGKLFVRGIRITKEGSLDEIDAPSADINMLSRLPDTREEIISIAGALEADLKSDIFLGEQATEKQVKTMDLSDRKVIAFATHALLPGDLDGLYQPAIALSSPSVTGNNDDGLLTMEEAMKLRLNADWVILSACNTGAAKGEGVEALSGLGQAFFYAGTRAMLVTMWPVETTSAKKITTELFKLQKENTSLSRARSLQRSILELIDNVGFKDKASGKIVASYAHPMLWAPFIIVGDGR